MNINSISAIIKKQTVFFNSGKTLDYNFRIKSLEMLYNAIKNNEENILEALKKDLCKSHFESYATEFNLILKEIKFHIKHLKSWMKPESAKTGLIFFPAKSFVLHEPYGVALIIAPWNYPFFLLLSPLIGAISAGNCAALKASHYSEHTADIIEKIINKSFNREYISIFKGGREVNQALLKEKYDYIFFTGSESLGKIVMSSAAQNLTPVTLELGGKSPCIVDYDADLNAAARRIVWGKFLNAGQVCVAPDYLFVHKKVKNELLKLVIKYIAKFYSRDPHTNPDYPRIVNDMHYDRLLGLMKKGKIIYGGITNKKDRYIGPTLIDKIKFTDPVMKEEIFGPVMPVFEYSDINDVLSYLKKNPKPLSFYYFSNDRKKQKNIMNSVSFGGGCINDTVLQIANYHLPFGGVGSSGIGNYHGKYSFQTFSHKKGVFKKSLFFDLPLRYPPYTEGKFKLLKFILKFL